jgi:hypothetical protein
MIIESTIINGTEESVHCLKKTRSVIRDADYDTGSICFQTKYGAINALGFYGNVGITATKLMTTDNLWYSETIGYSDATASTASAALAMNTFIADRTDLLTGGRLWDASTNYMKGIFNYYPHYIGVIASATSSNVNAKSSW